MGATKVSKRARAPALDSQNFTIRRKTMSRRDLAAMDKFYVYRPLLDLIGFTEGTDKGDGAPSALTHGKLVLVLSTMICSSVIGGIIASFWLALSS